MVKQKVPSLTEKKPYVRYEISCESIHDKGIAYSVKKAIIGFMGSHGYEHKVSDLKASSDRFSAVLEIFDNGNYDFNIRALHEHINNSGQLPNMAAIRPDEIVIRPVQCIETIQIYQENKEDISWQKTVEDLQKKLRDEEERVRGKDSSIGNLTNSLSERQRTIEDKERIIQTLESKLDGINLGKTNDPALVMLNVYSGEANEVLFELSSDWEALNLNEREAMLKCGDNLPEYIEFINNIYGSNFENIERLKEWKALTSKLEDNWEETKEGKELIEYHRKVEADKGVLQLAESNGASDEVIAAIRAALESNIKLPEEDILVKKIEFDKQKELYRNILNVEEEYRHLEGIYNNIIRRRESELQLGILGSLKFGKIPTLQIYLPIFDNEGDLEKYLISSVDDSFKSIIQPDERYVTHIENNGNNLAILRIVPKPRTTQNFVRMQGDFRRYLTEFQSREDGIDPKKILKQLGVQPRLISIIES